MKSVGIITLPGSYNYGNRLQAYATSTIYQQLGFDAFLLEIDKRPNYLRDIKSIVKMLLGQSTEKPEECMTDGRALAFSEFNHNVKIARYISTDTLCDRYSLFSVGSDQTWNPYYFAYNEDWYFLSFARPEQRIALAPSIGLDLLDERQNRYIAKGIAEFSSLSVRERRGAELIRECSGRKAAVICDPTLVLSAEEWRAVADNHLVPKKPYVFTYLLGGVGSEAADVLKHVTDNGRIPVIPLSDRQKAGEPDAGPAEFISLIDCASHVVTDSFHAAVFSSIFQKPLTIVHREGGASMFSRLSQLSKMLEIEDKVYGSIGFDLSKAGDYWGVPNAIGRERDKFMSYLEGCLDAQLPGWREGSLG